MKHDRSNYYTSGSIRQFLKALSALYLLNIYFKGDTYELGNSSEAESFNPILGSSLFFVKIYKNINGCNLNEATHLALSDDCTYVVCATDETNKKIKDLLNGIEDEVVDGSTKNIMDIAGISVSGKYTKQEIVSRLSNIDIDALVSTKIA